MSVRIGLISDTHGLLRPEALEFLRGCNHIVHAGDIGNAAILETLAGTAPLTVVRGNNDKGAWADALAETEIIAIADAHLYVIHNLAEIDIDPHAAGVQVVVSGHSHRPCIQNNNGVF